jgi:hypothetical protein
VAEKIYSGRIRVFPGEGGTLIYRLPLMGLCKLKVQINYGPQRFRQKRMMVENTKEEGRFIKEEGNLL